MWTSNMTPITKWTHVSVLVTPECEATSPAGEVVSHAPTVTKFQNDIKFPLDISLKNLAVTDEISKIALWNPNWLIAQMSALHLTVKMLIDITK